MTPSLNDAALRDAKASFLDESFPPCVPGFVRSSLLCSLSRLGHLKAHPSLSLGMLQPPLDSAPLTVLQQRGYTELQTGTISHMPCGQLVPVGEDATSAG